MGDSRALAFVESFVSEFIAECRDTLDELSKSKIAAGEGVKAVANGKMSEDAKHTLMNWLEQHLDNPYPTDAEKQELRHDTGLNMNQLVNWFVNARQRLVPKLKAKRGTDPSHVFDTQHINKKRRVEGVDRMEM